VSKTLMMSLDDVLKQQFRSTFVDSDRVADRLVRALEAVEARSTEVGPQTLATVVKGTH
jgi:hypothetical protein